MSDYEFTDKQNSIFSALSVSLRLFGIQLGVFAVTLIFLGLVFAVRGNVEFTDSFTAVAGGLGIALIGAMALGLCFLLLKPVAEFHQIVTTENRDISRLMAGLVKLARAHRLLRIILILLLISAALGALNVLP
jgi:hypothetical protein